MLRKVDWCRRFLVRALNNITGISCPTLRRVFHTFARFRSDDLDSQAIATYLLREALVACVPGSSFGPSSESYVPMSYFAGYDDIAGAVAHIHTALTKLRGEKSV